eukprot:COSAG02_NODE_794_length_17142_cov_13.622367_16_plen_150_part_00
MTKLHSLYPLCKDGTPGKLVPVTMCTSEPAPELDSKPVDGTTGLELDLLRRDEDDAVKQALTGTLPGEKKVPAEAQQARAKYQAMTLPQLKRTCADSWLEDGGSIGEMVDRLVAYVRQLWLYVKPRHHLLLDTITKPGGLFWWQRGGEL